MKKIVSLIITIFIISTLFTNVFAVKSLDLSFDNDSSTLVEVGDELVTYLVCDTAPTDFRSGDFIVNYDPSFVELTKIEPTVLSTKVVEVINTIDNTKGEGRIAFTRYPASNFNSEKLIKLTFKVLKDEESTLSLNKKTVILADTDNSQPEYEYNIEDCILFEKPLAPFKSSPSEKKFSGSVVVKLKTNTDGATIYYTTDGDTPTVKSEKYKDGIKITKSTTIKAIAVKNGVSSDVYSVAMSQQNQIRTSSGGGGGSSTSSSSTTLPATTTTTQTTKTTVTSNEKNQIILTIDNPKAKVFGEEKTNDVAPIIRNDRTMLPARFITEALGAEVSWDNDTRTVSIVKDSTKIKIIIDSDIAYVNDKEVKLDSPAFIENDRTYCPVRFFVEALGYQIDWNEKTREVTITK